MASSGAKNKKQMPDQQGAKDQQRFGYHVLYVTRVVWLLRYLGFYAMPVAIAWLAATVLIAMAGRATFAKIAIEFLASVTVNVAIAWGAAAFCGAGWALTAKSKRMLQRKNLSRIAELEQRLDPGRTSSGLSIEGEKPDEELP